MIFLFLNTLYQRLLQKYSYWKYHIAHNGNFFFAFHKICITSSNVRRRDKFVNLLIYHGIERIESAHLWNFIIIGLRSYLIYQLYSTPYVTLNWWRWPWIVNEHVFGMRLSCHIVWECYWHSWNQKVNTEIMVLSGVMCCGTIRPYPLRLIPWKSHILNLKNNNSTLTRSTNFIILSVY